jgi:hypothetical protein
VSSSVLRSSFFILFWALQDADHNEVESTTANKDLWFIGEWFGKRIIGCEDKGNGAWMVMQVQSL